jgi:hypothetical protein
MTLDQEPSEPTMGEVEVEEVTWHQRDFPAVPVAKCTGKERGGPYRSQQGGEGTPSGDQRRSRNPRSNCC